MEQDIDPNNFMATMKDVARLAGVSHGTVSNIINGAKGVSLDKVKRVEKAMKELAYEPNAIARSLRLSKSMQIDVILPNIVAAAMAQMYTNLWALFAEKGYVTNLHITNEDAELETRLLNMSLMHNVDGVMLATCQPQNTELFRRLRQSGLKIVFLQREPDDEKRHYVGLDARRQARSTVSQLLKAGYGNIGILRQGRNRVSLRGRRLYRRCGGLLRRMGRRLGGNGRGRLGNEIGIRRACRGDGGNGSGLHARRVAIPMRHVSRQRIARNTPAVHVKAAEPLSHRVHRNQAHCGADHSANKREGDDAQQEQQQRTSADLQQPFENEMPTAHIGPRDAHECGGAHEAAHGNQTANKRDDERIGARDKPTYEHDAKRM